MSRQYYYKYEKYIPGSVPYFGAPIGAISVGVIIDTIGRRSTILTGLSIHILGWTLLACNFNLTTILIGRTLTGLTLGTLFYPGQVYASECITVHRKRWRSSIASWNGFTGASGLFFIILMSYFLHYQTVAAIAVATSLTLIIIIRTAIPESPTWLYMQGRVSDAEQALNRLGLGQDTSILNNLRSPLPANEVCSEKFLQKWIKKFQQLRRKDVYRPALTLAVGNIIFMFSGAAAILTYQVDIVGSNPRDADSSTEQQLYYAYVSSVLSGFVVLVSQISISVILPLMGARKILFSSCICVAISMVLLGFTTGDQQNSSLYVWRSLAIWMILCSFHFGIKPVTSSITSDSFPADAKGFACISLLPRMLCIGLLLKVHPFLWSALNCKLFFIYAGSSVLGALYAFFFIHETVGKTLEEINESFRQ